MILENLTPEAERARLLKEFGLAEWYIENLKSLDVEEATWRINHEHKVITAIFQRKRQWLLDECVYNRPDVRRKPKPPRRKPKPPPLQPEFIVPHAPLLGST